MEESNKKLKKILILFILLVSILLLFGLWFSARNIVDGSYRVGDALRDVVIASDTDEGNAIKISSEISYEVATDVDVSLVESIIKSDLNGKFENMTGVSNYAINGGDIPDDILELRIGDYYKEGYSGIMFVSSLESVCVTEDNYVVFRYGDNIIVVCDYNDIIEDGQKVYVGNFYSLLLLQDLSYCEEVGEYKIFYTKG